MTTSGSGIPSRKNPPVWTGTTPYGEWRQKIARWRRIADGDPAELGPIVALASLSGQAQSLALQVPDHQLTSPQGFDWVMQVLDTRYAQSDADRFFDEIRIFLDLKQDAGETMTSFGARFWLSLTKASAAGFLMSDEGLGAMFLNKTRLPTADQRLVLAACMGDMRLGNVEQQCVRVFGQDKMGPTVAPTGQREVFYTGAAGTAGNEWENSGGDGVPWSGPEHSGEGDEEQEEADANYAEASPYDTYVSFGDLMNVLWAKGAGLEG